MVNLNISDIPSSKGGDCFHGEVWVRCPHCGKGMEMMAARPVASIGKYSVYKCTCGKLFKDA